jgi:RimJ/RimL family protein N-acetyltransferase
MTPLELTDGVVLLSRPTADDVDRITELCAEPSIAAWTTVPEPYRRQDAEWFVDDLVTSGWAEGRTATWGVRDPTSRMLHGMVGVDLVDDGEIGYWLGAHVRGRGWATRAGRLACQAAFDHGVDHVRWKAIVGNEASRRVALRVGFTIDGTVRRLVLQRGTWRDGWVGTLLREELR